MLWSGHSPLSLAIVSGNDLVSMLRQTGSWCLPITTWHCVDDVDGSLGRVVEVPPLCRNSGMWGCRRERNKRVLLGRETKGFFQGCGSNPSVLHTLSPIAMSSAHYCVTKRHQDNTSQCCQELFVISPPTHPFIHLPTHTPVNPSVHHPSIHPPTYPLSIHCSSIYLSTHPPIQPPIHLFTMHPSIHPFTHLAIHSHICPSNYQLTIHSLTVQTTSTTQPFIHPSTHPPAHPSIHVFIQSYLPHHPST